MDRRWSVDHALRMLGQDRDIELPGAGPSAQPGDAVVTGRPQRTRRADRAGRARVGWHVRRRQRRHGRSTVAGAGGTAATLMTPSGSALRCVTPAVGPSPMRRLTHFEYDNSGARSGRRQDRPAASSPKTPRSDCSNNAAAQTVPSCSRINTSTRPWRLPRARRHRDGRLRSAATGGATCMHDFITSSAGARIGARSSHAEVASARPRSTPTRTAVGRRRSARARWSQPCSRPRTSCSAPSSAAAASALPDAKHVDPVRARGAPRFAALGFGARRRAARRSRRAASSRPREQVEAQARRMLG